MHPSLQQTLRPVLDRAARIRWWWSWTLLSCAAASVGGILIWWTRRHGGDSQPWAVGLLAVAAVGAVWISWRRRRLASADDLATQRKLAQKIEHRFPELDQRLLTAVSIPADRETFFSSRLLAETRAHAAAQPWTSALPSWNLNLARLAGVGGTILLAGVTGMLLDDRPTAVLLRVGTEEIFQPEVSVSPGDVQLRRGTNLLVTARWNTSLGRSGNHLPDGSNRPQLILASGDGSLRRVPMTTTLDDPVWAGLVTGVDQSLDYRVETDAWSSPTYHVEVFELPRVDRIDATLKFPDYVNEAPRHIVDTTRVSAPEGTEVTWTCQLNHPVETAVLLAADGSPVPLVPNADDATIVSASLTPTETTRYRIRLTDPAGRDNESPPQVTVRIVRNLPPRLKPDPPGDVTVSPLQELTVSATVRDDFGLTRAGVTTSLQGGPPEETVLTENVDAKQSVQLRHQIDFESLRAEPDQLLTYFFWTEDLGPDGTVRRHDGDLYFADVRPFEEIFREGMSPPGGGSPMPASQAEELLELQKQIIQATWNLIRSENGDSSDSTDPTSTREDATSGGTLSDSSRSDSPKGDNQIFGDNPFDELTFDGSPFDPPVDETPQSDRQVVAESQQDALTMLQELAGQTEDAEMIREIEAVSQSMQQAVTQLRDSDQPLSDALPSQQQSLAGLLRLRAREFQVSRASSSSGGGQASGARQRELAELELKQDDARYETRSQATPAADQAQEEERQILSRLRELAQRQKDLNEELADLQAAIQLAESEEEKQSLQRQLARLRDQQREMLRDADELAQRLGDNDQPAVSPEDREPNEKSLQEQIQQTRQNMQATSEAIRREEVGPALASGRRAERELEELRDEFQRQTAEAFSEDVRELREQARRLEQQHQEISEQLDEIAQPDRAQGLRGSDRREQAHKAIEQQQEAFDDLTKQLQTTISQAEESQPLLAEQLFDAFDAAQPSVTTRQLEETSQLVRRGFEQQARPIHQDVGERLSQLREDLEQAAESVLGNETEKLQRALGQLEQLQADLENEVREQTGGPSNEPTDPSSGSSAQDGQDPSARPGSQSAESGKAGNDRSRNSQSEQSEEGEQDPGGQSQSSSGDSQQEPDGGQTGQGEQGQGQPGQGEQESSEQREQGQGEQGKGEQGEGQRGSGQQGEGRQGQGQSGQGQSGQGQSGEGQTGGGGGQAGQGRGQQGPPSLRPSAESSPPSDSQSLSPGTSAGGGGGSQRSGSMSAADSASARPLTGDGFSQWSDTMRSVEEMIDRDDLRSRATQIRQRVRSVRVDVKRHSRSPQWEWVQDQLVEPLNDLRREVSEELIRRTSEKQALVPIDRDPVPPEFDAAVREYYEQLGSGR